MTPDAIAADLAQFIHAEQFTELRALHVGYRGRTFAGWFDGLHLRDLAREALALSRQAAGVYFIPNPVDPNLAAKRLNKVLDVHRGFTLTHDADVLDRRFVIVDLDPRRIEIDPTTDESPRSQEIPTSAREVGFASRIARRYVRPFLANFGLPPPIVMLSGNGIHLVYQTVPVPAHECGNADQVACLLRILDERFSCWGVKIDRNTFNPSRMLKVPGTMVRKGEATTFRPYRFARLLTVPNATWREPGKPPAVERIDVDEKPTERERTADGTAAAPETQRRSKSNRSTLERTTRKVQPQSRLFDADAGPGGNGTPVH